MNRCLLWIFAIALIPFISLARPASEDARIERLLKVVKEMQGAAFIRSGKEYTGPDAEAHLRMKLGKAGERVQTAEQFIDGIAAKSYLTGKPYQIRFADGSVTDAGPYLHGKLKSFKP